MDKLSSSFMDISLVELIEWTYAKHTSSSVLGQLFPMSLHVWSITFAEFWWDDISSLVLLSSIISSLVLVIDSVSVPILKINEFN